MQDHGDSERLSAIGLSVGYDETTILDGLDFAVPDGTMTTGLKFPAIVDANPEGGDLEVPAELDADFVFATYRTDTLETPASPDEQLNAVVPDFCQYLAACQNNQFITVPREEASSNSFFALGAITYMVIANISGRDFVPFRPQ